MIAPNLSERLQLLKGGKFNMGKILKRGIILISLVLSGINVVQTAALAEMPRAGTVIYNGSDEGEIGVPDMPGDVVVKYLIPEGETVTTTTENRVPLTVGRVYGVEFIKAPLNQSGIRKATICYDYPVENTGNGTDTIRATLSNTPVPIWPTQLVEPTSAILIPEERATFTVKVTIGTSGTSSDHTIVITDGEGKSIAHANTTTLAVPRITLVKKITTEGPYLPGSKVGFRIEYYNEGDASADNMKIIDNIDPNIEVYDEFVYGTGSGGPFEIKIKRESLLLEWTASGSVPPGGSGYVGWYGWIRTNYIVHLDKELSQCLTPLSPTNDHYHGTISGTVVKKKNRALVKNRTVTIDVINDNGDSMVVPAPKVKTDKNGKFSCYIVTTNNDDPSRYRPEIVIAR